MVASAQPGEELPSSSPPSYGPRYSGAGPRSDIFGFQVATPQPSPPRLTAGSLTAQAWLSAPSVWGQAARAESGGVSPARCPLSLTDRHYRVQPRPAPPG